MIRGYELFGGFVGVDLPDGTSLLGRNYPNCVKFDDEDTNYLIENGIYTIDVLPQDEYDAVTLTENSRASDADKAFHALVTYLTNWNGILSDKDIDDYVTDRQYDMRTKIEEYFDNDDKSWYNEISQADKTIAGTILSDIMATTQTKDRIEALPEKDKAALQKHFPAVLKQYKNDYQKWRDNEKLKETKKSKVTKKNH